MTSATQLIVLASGLGGFASTVVGASLASLRRNHPTGGNVTPEVTLTATDSERSITVPEERLRTPEGVQNVLASLRAGTAQDRSSGDSGGW